MTQPLDFKTPILRNHVLDLLQSFIWVYHDIYAEVYNKCILPALYGYFFVMRLGLCYNCATI